MSTISAGTSSGTALVSTGDTSGNLELQSSGVTKLTVGSGGVTLASALPVASGGTGATSLTANNVLLGNGTSQVQLVAPSTTGNVLTSNGTTWTSSAPASSGTTSSGSFIAIKSAQFSPFLSSQSGIYPATVASFVFPSAANANNYDVKMSPLPWPSSGSSSGLNCVYRPVWNAYLGQWVAATNLTTASGSYGVYFLFGNTNGTFHLNLGYGLSAYYASTPTHTIYNPYTYTISCTYPDSSNGTSMFISTFPVNFSGSVTTTNIYNSGNPYTFNNVHGAFIDGGSSGAVEYVAVGWDPNAFQLILANSTNGTSWSTTGIGSAYSNVNNMAAQTNSTAAYFVYGQYIVWRLRGSGWYNQNLGAGYNIRSLGCNSSYLCISSSSSLYVSAAGGTSVSFTGFTPTTSGAPTGGSISWYETFWNGTAWVSWTNVGMFYNTSSNPSSGTWVYVTGSPLYPFTTNNTVYFSIGVR